MASNLKEIYQHYEQLSEYNRFEEELRRMEKKYLKNNDDDTGGDAILFCNPKFHTTINFIRSRRFAITRKFLRLIIEINEDIERFFRDTDNSSNSKFIVTATELFGPSQVDSSFLEAIPLKTHTLNVAKEAITISEHFPVQTACCNFAIALAHDFGKSPLVRRAYSGRVEELVRIRGAIVPKKDSSPRNYSETEKQIQKKTEEREKGADNLTKSHPHHYYSAVYLRDKAVDCGLDDLSDLFFQVLINHHEKDFSIANPSIVPFMTALKEADEGARVREVVKGRKSLKEFEQKQNKNKGENE